MTIFVDADACPNPIKEIIIRAANRVKTTAIFFANHPIRLTASPYVQFKQVPKGFDVADGEIEKMVSKHDLVITADIPLADKVIDKEAIALNVRGTLYTKANIKQKLAMRDFMEQMRDAGMARGGPSALNAKDKQQFANALDRYLQERGCAG